MKREHGDFIEPLLSLVADLGAFAAPTWELILESVRDECYPGLTRKQWQRIGWSRVRRTASTRVGEAQGDYRDTWDLIARFVHSVRLAKAAGSKTGKL